MKLSSFLYLAVLILSAGCAPAITDNQKPSAHDTTIVFLLNDRYIANWGFAFRAGAEQEISNCLAEKMSQLNNSLHFISPVTFRDSVYPWFEHTTAPKSHEGFKAVLQKPQLRKRLDALHLRYLVYLTGRAEYGETWGGWGCGAGYGGGGCLGYESTEKTTSLAARIWDLKTAELIGELDASETNRSRIIVYLLPFYVDSGTEEDVCETFAEELVRYFDQTIQSHKDHIFAK